jgi:hypothetical protein
MKYILSFFLTLSVLCTSLSAVEYGYLLIGQTVEVGQGDLFEVMTVSPNDGQKSISATNQGTNLLNISFSNIYYYGGLKPIVIGPATVSIYSSSGPDGAVAYKLTRASEVKYKNVNIVALPASTVGQGTHEIVVEASDDLQTWTPVHSSSIGGNKAFFRTRVVEAGD